MVACSLPSQPGPQPTDIIPTEFIPGFNVLGVIRVDGTRGSSFIHVQRAFRVEEATETFSPVIKEATVSVLTENPDSSYFFTFRNDSLRGDIYANSDFRPVAGHEYRLTVTGAGLPVLSASTVTPALPVVDTTSLEISPRRVSFTIMTTPDTGLYEVYLICETTEYSQQRINHSEQSQEFLFPLPHGEKPAKLEVYAYDSHLAEYLTAAITIKPQTYRETVTTVEGGYGCFGSVSKTVVWLQ